jgi:surface antigen
MDQPPSPMPPAPVVEGVTEAQDYLWGECTWWVAKRLHETVGSLDFYFLGGPGSGKPRHAKLWPKLAASEGLSTGVVPAQYAAVIFHRAPFLGKYGHVAFVEETYDDGTFLVSQYNWPNYHQQGPTERLDTNGVTFIYAKGHEPTTADIANYQASAAIRLDSFFRSIGSPLDGEGANILASARKYDIQQVGLWIGKMQPESHFCKDVYREFERSYHNCSGLKSKEILLNGADANGSQLRKFDSYAEYFEANAELWSRAYDHLSENEICGKWVNGHGSCSDSSDWLIAARQYKKKVELLL